MDQVNLGQESVKEVWNELKDSMKDKEHPDFKAFRALLSTMFQGMVDRKILPSMIYHW